LRLKPDHEGAQDRLQITRARINTRPQLEVYEREVARDPSNAEALKAFAHLNYVNGRFDEAIEGYKKYVRLRPKDADGLINSPIVYVESGQHEAALEHYKRSIELKLITFCGIA
jgi:tetratricopeptide (TPR) repeat protein